MNHSETTKLLAMVQSFDNRNVGDADVIAWQAVLYDVTLPNAQAAVQDHFRSSTDWLMPAHIRQGVKRVREQALAHVEDPCPPPELVDKPDEYRAWQLDARRNVANGASEPTRRDKPALPKVEQERRQYSSPAAVREQVEKIRERLAAQARERALRDTPEGAA